MLRLGAGIDFLLHDEEEEENDEVEEEEEEEKEVIKVEKTKKRRRYKVLIMRGRFTCPKSFSLLFVNLFASLIGWYDFLLLRHICLHQL